MFKSMVAQDHDNTGLRQVVSQCRGCHTVLSCLRAHGSAETRPHAQPQAQSRPACRAQEALASELAARMNAMNNASDNARDLRKKLTFAYNRKRQAMITSQLIEIVSGANA